MNVIVIACNSFHIGFLGAYGNSWIETPRLDRLASEGVVFDYHFPENVTTLPTRRSWWTGRYGFPDADSGWTPLRSDETILPDLLSNQGIRTAFISDVPTLREPGQGYGRGFDEVLWIRGSGYDEFVSPKDPRAKGVRLEDEPGFRLPPPDDPNYERWIERWTNVLRNRKVFDSHREENTGVARTIQASIDWLSRRAGAGAEPFLLWIDLLSPHGPWDLPEEYRDRYAAIEPDEFEVDEEGDLVDEDDEVAAEPEAEVATLIDVPGGEVGDVLSEDELLRLRRTYAGAVTLVDTWLGKLFDELKSSGRFEDTMVVFTADQGEPLGEHGLVRRFRPWLYEELIHTPLIIRLPKAERAGLRHQAIVQTVDLLPTVLSALGVPPSEDAQGHDLLPLIRGKRTKLRDYACLGMDMEEYAIRTHHWHLIVPMVNDPEEPRSPELYRKPEDRWEQNNVLDQHRDVADSLELALRRFAEAVGKGELEDLPSLREVARFSS